jgi:hypothetical protein
VESLYLFALYRFLVEGNKGAVLHTGDFRAEPCFLDSISRNPFLQRYLVQPAIKSEHPIGAQSAATLEAIYLDTASLLSKLDAPSKVRNHFTRLVVIPSVERFVPRNRQHPASSKS